MKKELELKLNYKKFPLINCPICNSRDFKFVTSRFDSGQIVECVCCKHIYLNPTIPSEELNKIYENYCLPYNSNEADLEVIRNRVEGWFKDINGPYQHSLKYLEGNLGFSRKRILDIGCGPGRFLSECKKMGAFVTGLDISPSSSKLAKEFFDLDIVELTLKDSIEKAILKKESFDYIFAFEIIEHVENPVDFLTDIHHLLSSNGLAFFSTPNFQLFFLMKQNAPAVSNWKEHIQFFTPTTLSNILSKSGFNVNLLTTLDNQELGDRLKQGTARSPFINGIWQKIRLNKTIYNIKNLFFNFLNKFKTKADINLYNGTSLFCVAGKGTSVIPG